MQSMTSSTTNTTRGAFHPRKEIEKIAGTPRSVEPSREKALLHQHTERITVLWSFLLDDAIKPLCETLDMKGFFEGMQHLYKVTESVLFDFEMILQEAHEIADAMEEGYVVPILLDVRKEEKETFLVSTIFEVMSKVAKRNIQAIGEICESYPEKEAQKKILRAIVEMRGASIRAQACMFVLLSILDEEAPKPTQLIWEEFLKEAFWNVKLFEQHSQKDLWSQTSQGEKKKEKLRRIMKKAKERKERSLGQSVDEEVQKGLKQRDDELYEEWVSYREHLNAGAASGRGENLPR
jgi:hypothetical protein